jgi:rare lipoprotein A
MHSSIPVFALIGSLTLIAVLVLGGCSSSLKLENAAAGSSSELALHVEPQGNDLRLTWNRHAPILANATGGILVIEDGDQPQRELPLTAALLQSGSVLYQPTSNKVRFRLDITSTQSTTVFAGQLAHANGKNRISDQVPATQAPDMTKSEHARASTRHPVTSEKSSAERGIVQESGRRARVQPLPSGLQDARETGIATFYNPSGQSDKQELAAAYARLPVGSRVRVTNLTNGRSIVVPIVRPGPTARGEHIINLSYHAAEELGFVRPGTAPVRVEPE